MSDALAQTFTESVRRGRTLLLVLIALALPLPVSRLAELIGTVTSFLGSNSTPGNGLIEIGRGLVTLVGFGVMTVSLYRGSNIAKVLFAIASCALGLAATLTPLLVIGMMFRPSKLPVPGFVSLLPLLGPTAYGLVLFWVAYKLLTSSGIAEFLVYQNAQDDFGINI